MKRLLLALALLALPSQLLADPCRAHCRDRARVCKDRCKINHHDNLEARHVCLERCDMHEHECRAHC
jgi:hypothetical protein